MALDVDLGTALVDGLGKLVVLGFGCGGGGVVLLSAESKKNRYTCDAFDVRRLMRGVMGNPHFLGPFVSALPLT